MQYQHEPDLNRSAVYDDGRLIGECCYDSSDQRWNIWHTEVDPAYGGQGIARELVELVRKAADEAGAELSATCSYAYKVLTEGQPG